MGCKKKVVLFGATGSIGRSALEVIRNNPDRLELLGLAVDKNWQSLAKMVQDFGVSYIALNDSDAYRSAQKSERFNDKIQWLVGPEGLSALASLPEVDTVVMAIPGIAGLQPTLAAIEAGKILALASKEVLVLAGHFVMQAAQHYNVPIYPLDSEHNGAFQCLKLSEHTALKRLILTASGGPFRDYSLNQMKQVRPKDALSHPTWSMGPKISIDSATMANKGLELIEARWLFNLPPEQLDVVVHPQSIVHALVEHIDGSVFAHLAPPSMTFAIQHALLYPKRLPGSRPGLDFSQCLDLNFYPPDLKCFPCLDLARASLEAGGCAPAVFNAANEVAVDSFISGKIPFLAIAELIEHTLQKMSVYEPDTLEAILAIDAQARILTRERLTHYDS